MGRFGAPHGVKGAIKLHSWSTPADNIFSYKPWCLLIDKAWKPISPILLSQGNQIIISIEGVDNRDEAAKLTNKEIYIDRSQLPKLSPGQYYWSDLAGMDVLNNGEQLLGKVAYVFNTGSNDILAIQGEHECMLPFLPETIINVDMPNNTILVNWDPTF